MCHSVDAILCSQSHISSCFINSCFTLLTLTPPDISPWSSQRGRIYHSKIYRFLTNPKMYFFMCFILVVSVKGMTSENKALNAPTFSTPFSTNISTTAIMSKSAPTEAKTIPKSTQISSHKSTTQNSDQAKSSKDTDCLLNLKNNKEMALWSIIALLSLICLLLLVIIMCLACKCCQGTKNNEMVMMKSSKITRNNSVNGIACETDLMYSSVRVENETTPDESEESKLVEGAAAEVPSANDTDETAPTQEVDQPNATDLTMEELEKAE